MEPTSAFIFMTGVKLYYAIALTFWSAIVFERVFLSTRPAVGWGRWLVLSFLFCLNPWVALFVPSREETVERDGATFTRFMPGLWFAIFETPEKRERLRPYEWRLKVREVVLVTAYLDGKIRKPLGE